MNIVSVYRIDLRNIGDRESAPAIHFPMLSGKEVDIFNIADNSGKFAESNVVIGGGGCVGLCDSLTNDFLKIRSFKPNKMVMWGVGNNRYDRLNDQMTKHDYQIFESMDLVGCRDWNVGFDWVPCASCMSKLFDKYKNNTREHDCVVYAHSRHKPSKPLGLPQMSNDEREFEKVIRFLASGDTVFTNSYHGAYWATLLGRKVVVVRPWSTKFIHMRHDPTMVGCWEDAPKMMNQGTAYDGALEECRNANKCFYGRVMNLFWN